MAFGSLLSNQLVSRFNVQDAVNRGILTFKSGATTIPSDFETITRSEANTFLNIQALPNDNKCVKKNELIPPDGLKAWRGKESEAICIKTDDVYHPPTTPDVIPDIPIIPPPTIIDGVPVTPTDSNITVHIRLTITNDITGFELQFNRSTQNLQDGIVLLKGLDVKYNPSANVSNLSNNVNLTTITVLDGTSISDIRLIFTHKGAFTFPLYTVIKRNGSYIGSTTMNANFFTDTAGAYVNKTVSIASPGGPVLRNGDTLDITTSLSADPNTGTWTSIASNIALPDFIYLEQDATNRNDRSSSQIKVPYVLNPYLLDVNTSTMDWQVYNPWINDRILTGAKRNDGSNYKLRNVIDVKRIFTLNDVSNGGSLGLNAGALYINYYLSNSVVYGDKINMTVNFFTGYGTLKYTGGDITGTTNNIYNYTHNEGYTIIRGVQQGVLRITKTSSTLCNIHLNINK